MRWLVHSRLSELITCLVCALLAACAVRTVLAMSGAEQVQFQWASDPTGQRHCGFIAQQVAYVLPNAVKTAGDDTMWLNTVAIIPYLVAGLQELHAKQQNEHEALRVQRSEQEALRVELVAFLGAFHNLVDDLAAQAAAGGGGRDPLQGRGLGLGAERLPRASLTGGRRSVSYPVSEEARALFRGKSVPTTVQMLLERLGELNTTNVPKLYEVGGWVRWWVVMVGVRLGGCVWEGSYCGRWV